MKTLLPLLILLFTFCAFSQTKKSTEYIFPEKKSEFAVTFPSKPTIETTFTAGQSTLLAELIIMDGVFLRAEVLKMTESAMTNLKNKNDEALSKIPLSYAQKYSLVDTTVKVGENNIGKYIKMRGTINDYKGESATLEIYFYLGKTEILALYACGYTKKYPTVTIVKFLNSLKLTK